MAHRPLRRCRGAHRPGGRGADGARGKRGCADASRGPLQRAGLVYAQALLADEATADAQQAVALEDAGPVARPPGAAAAASRRVAASPPPGRRLTGAAPGRARPVRGAWAAPLAERARRELRASGERSRRRDITAWDQLSPQESEIAHMAATGAVQPRDRRAAVPLASDRRGAPVPDLPQARRDVARAAAHGPRGGRRSVTAARRICSRPTGVAAAVRSLASDRPAAQTPPNPIILGGRRVAHVRTYPHPWIPRAGRPHPSHGGRRAAGPRPPVAGRGRRRRRSTDDSITFAVRGPIAASAVAIG